MLNAACSVNENALPPVGFSWMKALPFTSRYSLTVWPLEKPVPTGLNTQLFRTTPAFAALANAKVTAAAHDSFFRNFMVCLPRSWLIGCVLTSPYMQAPCQLGEDV